MCGQGAQSHAEGELEPGLGSAGQPGLFLASALTGCWNYEPPARAPACSLRGQAGSKAEPGPVFWDGRAASLWGGGRPVHPEQACLFSAPVGPGRARLGCGLLWPSSRNWAPERQALGAFWGGGKGHRQPLAWVSGRRVEGIPVWCWCRCRGPRSGSWACHSGGVDLEAHKCRTCVGDDTDRAFGPAPVR